MAGRLVILAVAVAVWLAVTGCGASRETSEDPGSDASPILRIGTKNFTEQFILGEVYAQALRAKGFRVALKPDLGSSELIDRVLTSGGIDVYAEYTGVIVQELARERRRMRSAAETYERAKAFEAARGFRVLDMSPGFDRLANAVTPATARRYRLRAMSDLKRLGHYRYGGFTENRVRFQGALGARHVYGLDFTFVPLRPARRYEALDRGRVDVIDVLTTEAQLAERSRYRVLADPEGIFGYQNIVPVINRDVLRAHGPGLAETLNAVTAELTNAALRKMNGAVDLDSEDPADVARRFLRDRRLL